jgi:hypothetical protein
VWLATQRFGFDAKNRRPGGCHGEISTRQTNADVLMWCSGADRLIGPEGPQQSGASCLVLFAIADQTRPVNVNGFFAPDHDSRRKFPQRLHDVIGD